MTNTITNPNNTITNPNITPRAADKAPAKTNGCSIIDLFKEYVIYFAGNPSNFPYICHNPFGLQLNLVDITTEENKFFFELLHQLDGLSYGNKSLAMDKWVTLDCGLLPSGFVGVAKYLSGCPDEILQKFDFSCQEGPYQGIVPISEYCAIPTIVPETWIGHTCATVDKGKKLGLFSKVLGLRIFGIKNYIGVAQYDNVAVKTHSTIADLLLKTAITAAHTLPEMTFIYEQAIKQEELEDILKHGRNPAPYSFLLDPNNLAQKKSLQNAIKKGAKLYITFPGQIYLENKLFIPILEK